MPDAEGFALAVMRKRGVSVTKEGTQYVCTITNPEGPSLDAEAVFEAAREHDLNVDDAAADVERGELYVFVDTNVPANGGGE